MAPPIAPDSNLPSSAESSPDDQRLNLFWRLVILSIAVTLLWRFVGFLAQFSGPATDDRLGHAIRAVVTTLLAIPLLYLARRYLDRRPWNSLDLPPFRDGWRPLLFGMALWFVAAGLGLLLALAPGWASIAAVFLARQQARSAAHCERRIGRTRSRFPNGSGSFDLYRRAVVLLAMISRGP